jgi:hypothetical protein
MVHFLRITHHQWPVCVRQEQKTELGHCFQIALQMQVPEWHLQTVLLVGKEPRRINQPKIVLEQ